jgi:hypothetical protein
VESVPTIILLRFRNRILLYSGFVITQTTTPRTIRPHHLAHPCPNCNISPPVAC